MKNVFEFAPATNACRGCGATAGQIDAGEERFLGTGQHLMLCSGCGLGYIAPDFTDASLNDFYVHHYRRLFLIDAAREHDDEFFRQTFYREFARLRIAEIAPKLQQGARLLELGSGFGAFLGELHKQRPDIELYATESDATHRTKLLDGAEVTFVEPDRIAEHGQFDAIVAFHIVEHLKTPVADLARARSCLTPGGTIVVEVPDIMRPWGSWSFVQPAHVSYFSARSLTRVMNRAGFKVTYAGRNPVGPALQDTLWVEAQPSQTAVDEDPATPGEIAELKHQIAVYEPDGLYRIKRRVRRLAVTILGPDRLGSIQRRRYWAANRHFFTPVDSR